MIQDFSIQFSLLYASIIMRIIGYLYMKNFLEGNLFNFVSLFCLDVPEL